MRPDLVPVVEALDGRIRAEIPDLQYALKWKRGFYGLPELGWIIELAAYSLSANLVFLGGTDLDPPPPLGDIGRSRYVKVRTLEEAQSEQLTGWIGQAARTPGWR
jgi:hypothetical protein